MKNTHLILALVCFFGLTAILTTLFIRSEQEGTKELKTTTVQDTFYFPQYPDNGTFWECQIEMGFVK